MSSYHPYSPTPLPSRLRSKLSSSRLHTVAEPAKPSSAFTQPYRFSNDAARNQSRSGHLTVDENDDCRTQSSRMSDNQTISTSGSHSINRPVYNTSIFSGDRNLVTGGFFNINIAAPSSGVGLFRLIECASKNAMHDSSARYPLVKCHPEVPNELVNFFLAWIKDPDTTVFVYWLHGAQGVGKTAIMQTIMDCLVEQGCRHLFAGGFFFGNGEMGRYKIDNLLATIAYQMAINIPGMRDLISDAMVDDPALPSKSLCVQLRSLLVDPLIKWKNGPHFQGWPTIFLDGLDQCDSIDSQLLILELIATTLNTHYLHVRFLVSSRPQSHLRDKFESAPLKFFHEQHPLNVHDEIKLYLVSEIDKYDVPRIKKEEGDDPSRVYELNQIVEMAMRLSLLDPLSPSLSSCPASPSSPLFVVEHPPPSILTQQHNIELLQARSSLHMDEANLFDVATLSLRQTASPSSPSTVATCATLPIATFSRGAEISHSEPSTLVCEANSHPSSLPAPAVRVRVSRAALAAEFKVPTQGFLWKSKSDVGTRFLFPQMDLNPSLPCGPMESGLLLSCRDELLDFGIWTLFIRAPVEGGGRVKLVYAGEYSCKLVGKLTAEQFSTYDQTVSFAF
ncbi:hypothetical protein CPB83DRAFT_3496 [Crepidotus variabilis]|uniref:NACHT domain-containing protein n=1 Tax=Crepidotus variabilis TaxID=179855 RepID=A0A9P6JWN7_9AGAR|nr:hypothetical protein CPB83DRAFT_3496 [Crepidotus variabilis]